MKIKNIMLASLLLFSLFVFMDYGLAEEPFAYDGWNMDVSSQETDPTDVYYNGTYFWVIGRNERVYRYFNNGTYTGSSFSVASQTIDADGIYYNGTYFWLTSGEYANLKVYRYFNNGTYTGSSFSVASQISHPNAITSNGSNIFITGYQGTRIYIYNMSGSFIDDLGYSPVIEPYPQGSVLSGSDYYIVGSSTDRVYKYNTGGTYQTWNFSVASESTSPRGLTSNGTYFWVIDKDTARVYRYAPTSPLTSGAIDDCSVNTKVIMNATIWDEINISEDLQARLEITFDLRTLNGVTSTETFSFDSSQAHYHDICINDSISEFTSDVEITYYDLAEKYVPKYYNIYNGSFVNTTITNISLYMLNATKSNTFRLTILDENSQRVENAYIFVQRYYISESVYRTVEIPKTDNYGNALTHLELDNPYYRYIITYRGETVYTGIKSQAYCTILPCDVEIFISLSGEYVFPFDAYSGVSYSLEFNESGTNLIIFDYIDVTGLTETARLYVYSRGILSDTTICDTTSNGASGTIVCNISSYVNDNVLIMGDAYLARSPAKHHDQIILDFKQDWKNYGREGVFWGFMIILVFAFIGIWNPTVCIATTTVGVILVHLLKLMPIEWDILIAVFIIAIMLIWKMRS